MPALLPSTQFHAPAVSAAPVHSTTGVLRRLIGEAPVQSITEGLAQALGHGQSIPSQPVPQVEPQALMQMDPNSQPRDTASMTVGQLLERLQTPGEVAMHTDESMETLRMQMFGRYYQELEGRMTELSKAMEGGVARARRAMLERVDELGAALHRDMVALRQETHKELEDLKRDVFTTVMSLSAVNDKMSLADSRNRETWVAITKALTDRIDKQARAQAETLETFKQSVDESMELRVVRVVEGTLVKLAAARRTQNPSFQASDQPLAATA